MISEIDDLVLEIKGWNKKNVYVLKEMLENLDYLINGDKIEHYVDITNLPTCELPENLNTLGVWAMDDKGNVLYDDYLIKNISNF